MKSFTTGKSTQQLRGMLEQLDSDYRALLEERAAYGAAEPITDIERDPDARIEEGLLSRMATIRTVLGRRTFRAE